MNEKINKIIQESIDTKSQLFTIIPEIESAIELIYNSFKNSGKIVLFGNGGSAADSQHIAAEFIGKFLKPDLSLPALSLTTNTSTLTAIGNDFGFDKIFERQINVILKSDDIAIGISTSGNSKNVLNAIIAANKIGAKTIGFTGKTGGELTKISTVSINIPSNSTQRIQECHILIGHIICELVESRF